MVLYDSHWAPTPPVIADGAGRFVLPRGIVAPLELRARAGDAMTAGPVEVRAGEEAVLRLVEHATARVTCQVVDDEGRPLPGIRASLGQYGGGLSGDVLRTTDTDGRVTFDDCAPGRNNVVGVTLPGYAFGFIDLALKPGEEHDAGTLRLVRADRKLAGFVLEADGSPAPMVMVSLSRVSNDLRTLTDAKGEFRFEGVAPGKQWLQAEVLDDGRFRSIEVNAGDENVVVKLKPRRLER